MLPLGGSPQVLHKGEHLDVTGGEQISQISTAATGRGRATPPFRERREKSGAAAFLHSYGVPVGAPAICHANARKDDAVRSIAGSTVGNDCTKSLNTALVLLNCE
jgi:hypothetical protein